MFGLHCSFTGEGSLPFKGFLSGIGVWIELTETFIYGLFFYPLTFPLSCLLFLLIWFLEPRSLEFLMFTSDGF